MKRISFWANRHMVLARIIIVVAYLFLNLLGFILGDLLYLMNVELNSGFFYITASFVLIAILVYPIIKTNKFYKHYYARKKITYVLLTTATFLFIIYSANCYNSERPLTPLNSVLGISVTKPNVSVGDNIGNASVTKKHLSKKENKKNLRSFIRAVRKKYKDATSGQKTLSIILVVLGGILLVFLMAGLSCSIICSGAEVLGWILLVLGVGGIIFGMVKLIQRIQRGKPKKELPDQPK